MKEKIDTGWILDLCKKDKNKVRTRIFSKPLVKHTLKQDAKNIDHNGQNEKLFKMSKTENVGKIEHLEPWHMAARYKINKNQLLVY